MQTTQTAPIVRQLKYALKVNKDRNVYIGSGEKARHIPRSPFAMPYELRIMWTGDQEKDAKDRDEKIAQYKIWLWDIMKNQSHPKHQLIWTKLRSLREDSILLCYCYPRNCHGHVIVAAWKWAVAQGKIDAPKVEPPLKQPTVPAAQTEERMMADARRNLTKTTTVTVRHGDKGEERTITTTPALLPPHTAPGPLDMPAVMERLHKDYTALADARLDEKILAEHVSVCPDCDEPKYIHLAHHHADCTCEGCHYENNANNTDDTLMVDDVPETHEEKWNAIADVQRQLAKEHRKTRRPRLSFDEPRSLVWNEYDEITADLTDLYARAS